VTLNRAHDVGHDIRSAAIREIWLAGPYAWSLLNSNVSRQEQLQNL